VLTAAQLLGKSPRQVQRLLKQGKLVGHKIAGRNGLEWKIDREVLSFNSANLSINDAMAEQIAAMEIKIEGLADAMVALKSRIESFDSQFDRIRKSESISESTASELGLLKDQLDQTKKIIQEVAALERQEERRSPEREITEPIKFDKGGQDKGAQDKGRQDKGPKLSWWQRVLAEKQFV
jgi:hypothetical protein